MSSPRLLASGVVIAALAATSTGCTMLIGDKSEVETTATGQAATSTQQPVTESAAPSESVHTTMPAPTTSNPAPDVTSPAPTPSTPDPMGSTPEPTTSAPNHGYAPAPGAPPISSADDFRVLISYMGEGRSGATERGNKLCPRMVPGAEVGLTGKQAKYVWVRNGYLHCRVANKFVAVESGSYSPRNWLAIEQSRQKSTPDLHNNSAAKVAAEVGRIEKQHGTLDDAVLCTIANEEAKKAGFGDFNAPNLKSSVVNNGKQRLQAKTVMFCVDHRIIEVSAYALDRRGLNLVSNGRLIAAAKKVPERSASILRDELARIDKK